MGQVPEEELFLPLRPLTPLAQPSSLTSCQSASVGPGRGLLLGPPRRESQGREALEALTAPACVVVRLTGGTPSSEPVEWKVRGSRGRSNEKR